MKAYYQGRGITLYHGDALTTPEWLTADTLLTDPPYGISYRSGQRRVDLPRSIAGDADTRVRDDALALWGDRPALVFGSWRRPRPVGTRMLLVWDTGGALGMGDLRIPWKPSHQEIYVLGGGFSGRRTSDVLAFPPVQSMAKNGRLHPHEKPVELLRELLRKSPPGVVADPFAGSGSLAAAALAEEREAILVESDEGFCELIADRVSRGDAVVKAEAATRARAAAEGAA